MTKKHVLVFTGLALTAFAAYAVSVPNIFSAGDPARAADVNANFTALANAVSALETTAAAQANTIIAQRSAITTLTSTLTALQATVAALADTVLTAADVVGTYKVFSHSTQVGGSGNSLFTAVDGGSATVTFTATSTAGGTLTLTPGPSSFASANCAGATVRCGSTVVEEAGGNSGNGTWTLGPDANTITVVPPEGPELTAFISKRGGVGFALTRKSITPSGAGSSGRAIILEVFIKQ